MTRAVLMQTMFYTISISDHIRVPPRLFDRNTSLAVIKSVRHKYEGFVSEALGIVIDVVGVTNVGEGVIIPGDGACYYQATFELLTFKPELQEVITGKIRDIADFGAFMPLGPIDGMIHISQTMDDFVSFAKDKVLTGRDSKHTLKVGDLCRARVIAVSFKDPTNPKISLTMRQPGLGKIEWIEQEQATPAVVKEEKIEPKKKKETK
ncbi:MAG: DNA-directed RNA polymerase [Candidatus Woesearchaeota archaeon]|nr:DNA-directed RNA polymerase [Candidatus Woesearchaeota archaeon]